jgi:hypothetical protein
MDVLLFNAGSVALDGSDTSLLQDTKEATKKATASKRRW